MKTPEELKELKEEVETLNKKLHELTEEEFAQVSGGGVPHVIIGGHIIDPPIFETPVGNETSSDE